MKKLFLILFVVFFISEYAKCQQISISPEIDTRNDYTFDLLGKVGNKILAFRKKNKKYILNIYDKTLYRVSEKTISLEKKNTDIVSVVAGKNDFTVFYTLKKKNTIFLKAVKFNETGTRLDSTMLFQQKHLFSTKPFLSVKSRDKKIILIYRIIENKEIEFTEFNIEKFKRIYYKKIKFKDVKLNNNYYRLAISNKGNIYFMFEKKPSIFSGSSHKIIINAFYPYSKKRKKTSKNIKVNTGDINIVYDDENEVLNITGIITKLYDVKAIGYFVYKLDENLLRKGYFKHYFKEKLLSDYYRLEIKKKKKYIRNLYIKNLELRNDGGIVLVLEVKEIIKRKVNTFNNRQDLYSGDTDYIFGNIILISIHENGEEFWEKIIPKYQMSTNDYGIYSSFFIFKIPSSLKLLFNDEIKNKNQVIMYSVSPTGEIKRQSVFTTDMYKLNLSFNKCVQISNKKLIIPSYKKEKLKLVLVEL